MNDNAKPVKAWEIAVLFVLAWLLIGLVLLSYFAIEVKA